MATQPPLETLTSLIRTVAQQDIKLLDARRNQLFGNQPVSGPAQCPLKTTELAIFPIRYALDESPPKGSSQGPNPLPPGWSADHLPRLETRSYTLRQLRDGWLYVWDDVSQELHEYSVSGHKFTRHAWGTNELLQDERNNPGNTKPYLLYPRRSNLSLAFSPVQWSWRLCERIRSDASLRTARMRTVSLPNFCASLSLPHGGLLNDLGAVVADILPGRSPDFLTTHTPTRPSGDPDDKRSVKPIIDEALVIGSVPEKDDALFVALDDPVAIVEDLLMHLAGRRMEHMQFEEAHRRELETAMVVQQLCGIELDELMPEAVKSDPARREAFTQDAQALMEAQDMDTELALQNSAPFMSSAEMAMASTEYLNDLADKERTFQTKWGVPPRGPAWVDMQVRFNQRATWRGEVKFTEAVQFLRDSEATFKRFETHGQSIEKDVAAWLVRLGRDPLTFFYDPCMPEHSMALLDLAGSVALHMGGSQSGRQWLSDEFQGSAQRAKTLLGTALFNFDPELETLIKRVVDEFAHSQQLDIGGQGDGSGQAFTGLSEATNVAGRLNETRSVLDLDAVKNSTFYRNASESTRRGFEVLRHGLRQEALKSWLMLSELTLPALPRERLLPFVTLQVMVSEETFTRIQVSINPEYAAQYTDWHKRTKALLREIHTQQGQLNRPATAQTRRDVRLQLATKREQLRLLTLEVPQKLIGKPLTQTLQRGVQEQAYASWLSDLGRDELKTQWALKAQNAAQHTQRLKAWVDLHVNARGGALPITVAALSLWNLQASWQQASRDGAYSEADLRVISSNMAYTANAVMALWTMPMWSKYAKGGGMVREQTTELAQAGVRAWAKERNVAFARIARSLVLRTMAYAAFGAVAAGLEAWQVTKDIEGATSGEEATALTWKKYSLLGMMTLSATQLAGSIAGIWFSFAWVMGPAITIAIFAAGIVYLLSSFYANHFKREGLRLWLYRCAWGKISEPYWPQTEQGHADEMQALVGILLRPSVLMRQVSERRISASGKYTISVPTGFWLQLLLPAEAANGTGIVELQAAMVVTSWMGLGPERLLSTHASFYQQFVNGHWAPLKQLGQLPRTKRDGTLPADTQYEPDDTHRLWQTWVSYNAPPVLELEVTYPQAVLDSKPGQSGYQFRIDASSSAEEAERKNTAFGFEPSLEMLLSQHSTQKLLLPIP